MENPHYVALTIAIGSYILSELLLWRFPRYNLVKYIPTTLGMIGSILVAIISYQRIIHFGEFIHYLFFSIVLFCLCGIFSVIISVRKPFGYRNSNNSEKNNDDDELADKVEIKPDNIKIPETQELDKNMTEK